MYCVNMPCIYKSMQGIRVLPSMERLHYITLNVVTYSKSGMAFLPMQDYPICKLPRPKGFTTLCAKLFQSVYIAIFNVYH